MKLAIAILALAAQFATAATVFDNGESNLTNAAQSDSNSSTTVADNFTLSGATTLRAIQWWGIYVAGNTASPDSFTINIFLDNANAPGALVATPTVLTLDRQNTGSQVLNN